MRPTFIVTALAVASGMATPSQTLNALTPQMRATLKAKLMRGSGPGSIWRLTNPSGQH